METFKGYDKFGFLTEWGDAYVDCSPPTGAQPKEVYDQHFTEENVPSSAELIYRTIKIDDEPKRKATEDIVRLANLQDQSILPPDEFRAGYISTYLIGLQAIHRDDVRVMADMLRFLNIILYARIRYHVSVREYERLEVHGEVRIGEYMVAYYDIPEGLFINPAPYLFLDKGVDFCVYKMGNNIGILRNVDCKTYHLQRIQEFIDEPEWFFHKDGFLASRGTNKHPKSTPSKYSIQDILEILKRALGG